jgi:hypothetical protein
MNISILRKNVAEKPKKSKVFVEDSSSLFNRPQERLPQSPERSVFIQKKNHFDVFSKPFRWFWKVITMFL